METEGRRSRAKLSREQTDEVRRLFAQGTRQTALAAQFGVSQALISKVVAGWSPLEPTESVKALCGVIEEGEDEPCPREARAKGYCTKHYQRWKAYGDPTVVTPHPGPQPGRFCTVEGCSEERKTSKLYCEKHRARMRRHGDVTVALKDHTPAAERWKGSYVVGAIPEGFDTPCWNWTGPIYKRQGHGFIQDGADKRYMAHRFVWEQIVGPIPKGMVLDHLCKNKRCVNPRHLEAVTQAINCYRGGTDGGNAAKTQCGQGHEYTAENTYVNPNTGWRQCRTCLRALHRRKKYRYAYIYLYRPHHPVADRSGRVQEHRMVLYDAIGPGPHPCHWHGGEATLTWGGITGIHVDHIDGDPSNNCRENLVPSCQSCNKSRAASGNLADWRPPVAA